MLQQKEVIASKELAMSNLNLKDLESLRKEVQNQVYYLVRKFNPHRSIPVEDIGQDCFTTLWSRGFFGRYDGTKSMYSTYLYNGVKNYLIDQERSASVRIQTTSFEKVIYEDLTYGDILDRNISNASIGTEVFFEVLSVLKNRKIKYRGKERIINIKEGEFRLSEYTVLYMKYLGYNLYEIADLFKVSSTYVSNLFNSGIKNVKEHLHNDCEENVEVIKRVGCPYCRKNNIRFWDLSWTGYPLFVCKDCGKTFNLFTSTPLNNLRVKDRDNCLLVMKELSKGKDLKHIAVEYSIEMTKCISWARKYWNYFESELNVLINLKLGEWEKIVKKVKVRMTENNWVVLGNPLEIRTWI